MADLQKTIDRCKKSVGDGEPIYDYKFYYDVIELLAEKKPIEPYITGYRANFEGASSWWYSCGNCNKPIDHQDMFCRHCGRKVKWDD